MDDLRTKRLAKELLPAVERQYPFWPITAWPLHLAALAGPVIAVLLRLKGVLMVVAILMWIGVVAAVRLILQSRREAQEALHIARTLDAMLDTCESNEHACIRRKAVGNLRKRVLYRLEDNTARQAALSLELTVSPALAEAVDVSLHNEAERLRQSRMLGDLDHRALLDRLSQVTRGSREDSPAPGGELEAKPDQKSPESH